MNGRFRIERFLILKFSLSDFNMLFNSDSSTKSTEGMKIIKVPTTLSSLRIFNTSSERNPGNDAMLPWMNRSSVKSNMTRGQNWSELYKLRTDARILRCHYPTLGSEWLCRLNKVSFWIYRPLLLCQIFRPSKWGSFFYRIDGTVEVRTNEEISGSVLLLYQWAPSITCRIFFLCRKHWYKKEVLFLPRIDSRLWSIQIKFYSFLIWYAFGKAVECVIWCLLNRANFVRVVKYMKNLFYLYLTLGIYFIIM